MSAGCGAARASAERGGVALAALLGALLSAAVAALVLAATVDVGVAAARARTAADAAALAGAGDSPLVGGHGRPCRSAARVAAANGAVLRACRLHGLGAGPASAVTVVVGVAPRGLGTPAGAVRARATAAALPLGR